MSAMIIAVGASAQLTYDLSVTFEAYTAGASVNDSPMNGVIVVKNEGPTIPTGDTLFYNYIIDGSDYNLDLGAGFVNYTVLVADMLSGDEMSFGNPALAWAELGITVDLCANVYGVGQASFLVANYLGDTDSTNNKSCIAYTLPEVDDASIENFDLALGNIYIAGGQLMIVNEGVNSEEIANLNIVSMSGQIVQTENVTLFQGTNSIEIANLVAGIYIIAIEVDGAIVTRKVSIQ